MLNKNKINNNNIKLHKETGVTLLPTISLHIPRNSLGVTMVAVAKHSFTAEMRRRTLAVAAMKESWTARGTIDM